MRIDVVIATFERAHLIERAVNSVLAQTYKNFILHVVDDGSSDKTQEILSKYQTHPQVRLYSQTNKGVSAARNMAALSSTNEWISFLDSDDEWMPDKLEKQVHYIKENPLCRFLHSEEIWIRNGVRVNPKKKHSKENELLFERSLEHCLISPSTVMISRDLFLKHRGFDEDFIVCEDYDLWLKILAEEKNIGFIQTPLINKYGGHEDQLSKKYVAMDYWRIKSLSRLFYQAGLNEKQKQQIRTVIIEKTAILLNSYQKYNNQPHYEEIKRLTSPIISL